MSSSRVSPRTALGIAIAALVVVTRAFGQSNCASSSTGAVAPSHTTKLGAAGFRVSVSGSGDKVATSTAWHTHNGIASGAAWVFTDPGTPAQAEVELLPSNATENMYFGHSLAMNAAGDVVIVGAPTAGSFLTPRVFVFRFDGTNWV